MDHEQSPEKRLSLEPCFSNPLTYRLPIVHTDSAPNPLVHCLHPPFAEDQQQSIAPFFLPPSVGDSEDGTIMSYASEDAGVFSDAPFPFDDYLPTAGRSSHKYESDSTNKNVFNGVDTSYGSVRHTSYATVDESNPYFVELTQQSFVPPNNILSSNLLQNVGFQSSSDIVAVSCGSNKCNIPTIWPTSESTAVTTKEYYPHVYYERQSNQLATTNSDPQTIAYPEVYQANTLNHKSWEENNQDSRISSYVNNTSAYPNYSIPENIQKYRTEEFAMYSVPVPNTFHPHANNSYNDTQGWTYNQPNFIHATQNYDQSVYQYRSINENEMYSFSANETRHLLSESTHLPSAETPGYWDPNISAQAIQPFPTSFERGAYSRELSEILPSNYSACINDSAPSHIDTTIHNPSASTYEHAYRGDSDGIFAKQLSYNPISPAGANDPNTFAFSNVVTQTSTTAQTENEFHCSHCSRAFQRPSHLEIHMRTHTGERPYECILCGRHFSQVSNLRRHMESHKAWPPNVPTTHPSGGVQGNVNQTPSSNVYTTLHTSGNKRLRQWNCRFCVHTFDSYLSLRAHMTEHKEMRVFACVFQSCTHTFQTANALFVHVMEQHRDLTDCGSTCHTCNRTFTDVRQLAQHWLPRRRGLPPRCRPSSAIGYSDNFVRTGASREQTENDRQLLGRAWKSSFGGGGFRIRRPGCRRKGRLVGPQHRLSVRLLRLRGSANSTKLRVFRCPLCSKRCRSLPGLRQHLATAEHADELAAVVRQSSVSNVTSSGPGEAEATRDPEAQPDSSPTPVRKTALFLIQLEEDKVEEERRNADDNNRSVCPLYPGKPVKSCPTGGKLMTCNLCNKHFQKLKFFEDHELMCQQAVNERARRQRLREQRKAHFRVSLSDDAELAGDSQGSSVCDETSGASISALASSFDSSALITGANLRRSGRQRCFQQRWNAKKPRGFELAITREAVAPLLRTRVSPALEFELLAECKTSRARCSQLWLPHCPGGPVQTPVFMPVGTQGSMKGITVKQLEALDCRILLGNTYHLGHRPGTDIISKVGGLHRFMAWPRAILTDSGGFQMVSLSDLSRVDEVGVHFTSPHNASQMLLTPEESVGRIQATLGADVVMQLDHVVHVLTESDTMKQAMHRSIRWLDRCILAHDKQKHNQNLFAITQGGLDASLRQQCIEEMLKQKDNVAGFAIGGLSGGEAKDDFWKTVHVATGLLPRNRPRYLMGVGFPVDLIVCIALGCDMFDCVYPTRTGRFGHALVPWGQLNLRHAKYSTDFRPITEDCRCPPCSRPLSRAYINAGLSGKQMYASATISLHNLAYMFDLMRQTREAITDGRFPDFVRSFFQQRCYTASPGQDKAEYEGSQPPAWAVDALASVGIDISDLVCAEPVELLNGSEAETLAKRART